MSATPDDLAEGLSRKDAWDGTPVEWIQTHISHVFLVGDRVYKLRKAAHLPFLDFRTREARNADCLRELALNRRLAPEIYLGVAPVRAEGDAVRVGTVGESIDDPEREHVVVMRRLAEGGDALARLERDALSVEQLERTAVRLARFHADHGLGRPAPWSADAWRERIAAPMVACVDALAESGLHPAERIGELAVRLRARLEALGPALETRRLEGRAVDGHGDVHLQHVWFEHDDAEPVLVDCLEFDDELRRIDPASEVAFLAMDLRYRDRADLAEAFLSAYALETDDYGLFAVVDLYASYRALVRAKVAAVAASQASIAPRQREAAARSVERHLALAEALLEPPARGAMLVLCGTVGSGKSTAARALARRGLGTPIASDRVRKAIEGLAPDARRGDAMDEGLYDPQRVERVYAALLERAAPVLDGGRTAILDAGYGTRTRRDAARAFATERGVAAHLVEVRCGVESVRGRLEARARADDDPSDAGPDFLETSLSRFEPPDEWPAARRHGVETDVPGWEEALGRAIRRGE